MATTTKTNPLDAKQERFLGDLEKGEKTVDLIFQDHEVPPDVLEGWLSSRAFQRAIDGMRERMSFRLEQDLVRGAMLASERLGEAVKGSWVPQPAQVQALVNTIKLCQAVVRNPKLKREAAAAAQRAAQRRAEAGFAPGYHHSHTPDQAAALLRRLQKRRRREERLDRDQDENGKWMPAD